MKRSMQDGDQEQGRETRLRQHPESSGRIGAGGSNTVVLQEPVLSLNNSRVLDGAGIDLGHMEEQEYNGSGDESDSEGHHEESDIESEATVEDLLKALKSKAPRTRVQALKLILNQVPELTAAEQTSLVEIAQRMLYIEGDKGVKILLIQVLQTTVETTALDGRSIVEHLLNQLQADSTEVRVQVYDAISYIIKIGKLPLNTISDINTVRALMTMSIAELRDRHHRVRSAVLQLVAQLAPLLRTSDLPAELAENRQQGYSQHDIQLIVSNYVTDPEPRVRKTACKTLLELHRKGFKLALVMYDVAIQALLDDYQEVRMEGLDLIYILSGLYPEMTVQSPLATQLQATRLVDDAFIRVCDMVNDSSMTVRAKFKSVDYKFLSQTFSKQIMARLKVDIAPKNLAAGPAQKQAQRAKLIATPEGDQDVAAQQVRLLDSGACGAFVHGLEDEYQDVRNAAINSIRELCLNNPEFSLLALDYMVGKYSLLQLIVAVELEETLVLTICLTLPASDMFMDEIDYVRLNALTSLCKIGGKAPITFDTEQLQIALGVLEDADRDVRESTHRMLEVVTMATADGMTSFLTSLESNMKRFPEDQLSIYQCIRAVARRHGAFVDGGHLILIFNAAITNPRILQMLPKYAYRHYTYLRDKYLNCFPEPSEIICPGTQSLQDLASALTMTIVNDSVSDMEVESSENSGMVSASGVTSAYATTIAAMRVQTAQDAESFYERALDSFDRIYLLWRNHQQSQTTEISSNRRALLLQQIGVCQRDLRYIVNVHAKQARNAEFADMYLECCNLLVQIQDSYDTPSFIVLAPVLSAQLFRLSYYMDHTFLGVSATAKISVGCFRILANLVWFFGMAQKKLSVSSATASISSLSWPVQKDRGLTKEYLQSMLQLAIKRITDLLSQMDQPEVDHKQVQNHRRILGDLRIAMLRAFKQPSTPEIIKLMSNIVRFVPMEVDFGSLNLQRIVAHITKPSPNRDNPQDVHPSFPFLVQVEGTIHNVRDTSGIAVQITFPQDVVRHYYPPPDHFSRVDAVSDVTNDGENTTETYRLRTSIEIYPDAAWGTTPTELRITLSRSFQPDLVGHDEFICRFAEEIAFKKREQLQQRPSQQTVASAMDSASRRSQQPLQAEQDISLMFDRSSVKSSTPGSSLSEQSTLELSKSVSYFVTRRNIFT
ncbi:Integrator complex subunit 4 [Mortierella sp. AD094]|nr:Integrator complex subunit 4 [Mortierella sp. AD094]